MTDQRNDLPPASAPNFLEKVREALSTYLGTRGDRLDRGLTVRDLSDAGLVDITPGYLSGRGRVAPIMGIGNSVEPVYVADLTPPPTPTGFSAVAAISNIMVECAAQTYTVGHGHGRSKLYGATWISGPLPVFADAVLLEEFQGTVFSHATNPATTWHLWLTWVSVDGVESTSPAGGTNGVAVTTGQDVASLLAALTGELTASQLHADLGSRINIIDGGVAQPALAYPLAKLAALQDAANQKLRIDVDSMGTNLLSSLVTINNTLTTVHDAGITVDPGSGLVVITGLEAANTHLTTVDARLSAAEGSILLKATTTYVDNAIATAVLDPTQVPIFGILEARVTTAELDINSLEGSVALKANTLDLSATNVRMTTAETNISSLEGTILTKVSQSSFDAVTGGLDTRLGSAETLLSVVGDTSTLANEVFHSSQALRRDDADAEALLRSILNNENTGADSRLALATAKNELSAYTDAGVAAEAAQRLLLVSVVDGHTSAISAEALTRATQTGELYAQYTVKLDVDGKVSGFGLASSGPGGPGSAFEIRADKFSIAAPTGATAGYVPFTVVATAYTNTDGVYFPAGVYAANAYILDGQITNAKIANLAVDNAKITDLSATKLTAGSIAVGQHIESATYSASGGTTGWHIGGDGNSIFNNATVRGEFIALGPTSGDYARMFYGNVEIYKQVPGVGSVAYKALSRIETGVASNNTLVTIPGYFKSQPKVIVSPNSMQLYSAAYAGQNQSINCSASAPVESYAGSMVWRFTPTANLVLASGSLTKTINQTSGAVSATNWTSSTYTTDANTSSITPVITIASNRGNGASQYFYRTVRWRVEYLVGVSTWVTTGAFTTTNLGADTAASSSSSASFTFPYAGTWVFRIYAEVYDTSTAVFGAASYTYSTATVTYSGTSSHNLYSGVSGTSYSLAINNGTYTPTAPWELDPSGTYSTTYSYSYTLQGGTSFTSGQATLSDPSGTFIDTGFGRGTVLSGSATKTKVSTTDGNLSFGLSASGWTGSSAASSAYVNVSSSVTTVKLRALATNSTIPSSTYTFGSYSEVLSTATVLATGTLNWVAVGD